MIVSAMFVYLKIPYFWIRWNQILIIIKILLFMYFLLFVSSATWYDVVCIYIYIYITEVCFCYIFIQYKTQYDYEDCIPEPFFNVYHAVGYAFLISQNKYYKNCCFLCGDFQIIIIWILIQLNNLQWLYEKQFY